MYYANRLVKTGVVLKVSALVLAVSLLAGCAMPAVPAAPAANQPSGALQRTEIARGSLNGIPAGDFVFRVGDAWIDPGNSVTHRHVSGMVLDLEGEHDLTIQGQSMSPLQPGQAMWVSAQITHTHTPGGKVPMHFQFLFFPWPAENKLTPTVPGVRNSAIVYTSEVVTFTTRGKQDVVLAEQIYAAGETSTQTMGGPTLLKAREGRLTVTLGAASTTLDQNRPFMLVPAGVTFSVKAETAAKLLTYSCLPAIYS